MPVWTFNVTINGTMKPADTAYLQVPIQFSPLQFTFEADCDGQHPQFTAGSVTGQYTANFQIILPPSKGDAGGSGQVAQGSDISDASFTVTRSLQYQFPEQAVSEGPGDQPPQTIRIDGSLTIGSVQYTVDAGQSQHSGTTTVKVPIQIDVPYDPTLTQQQASVSTNSPNGQVQGSASVTITREQLQLVYNVLSSDNIGQPGISKGNGAKVVSQNVAEDSSWVYVHGNNHIDVLEDGAEAGSKYNTFRLIRQSTFNLGKASGSAPGSAPWDVDTEGAGPSWDDIPGLMIPVTTGSAHWTPSGNLLEFLVRVENMPEFGALYFAVVADVKPNAFRVEMFPATSIDGENGWSSIRNSPVPTPGGLGGALADTKMNQVKVPAAPSSPTPPASPGTP